MERARVDLGGRIRRGGLEVNSNLTPSKVSKIHGSCVIRAQADWKRARRPPTGGSTWTVPTEGGKVSTWGEGDEGGEQFMVETGLWSVGSVLFCRSTLFRTC